MSLKKISKIILKDFEKKEKRYNDTEFGGEQTRESHRETIEYTLKWIKRTSPEKFQERHSQPNVSQENVQH